MNIFHNILLIDDDPIFNLMHSKIIQNAGIAADCRSFTNPAFALEALSDAAENKEVHGIYTIFLDINMPEMDGWSFLDKLVSIAADKLPGLKVYMLSSSNNEEEIQKAQTYSLVKGFVSKPLLNEHLNTILKQDQPDAPFYLSPM